MKCCSSCGIHVHKVRKVKVPFARSPNRWPVRSHLTRGLDLLLHRDAEVVILQMQRKKRCLLPDVFSGAMSCLIKSVCHPDKYVDVTQVITYVICAMRTRRNSGC